MGALWGGQTLRHCDCEAEVHSMPTRRYQRVLPALRLVYTSHTRSGDDTDDRRYFAGAHCRMTTPDETPVHGSFFHAIVIVDILNTGNKISNQRVSRHGASR